MNEADYLMDLLALRKAAVLAHWVPGVSLVLFDNDNPVLTVSADPQLTVNETTAVVDPCSFRYQVYLTVSGSPSQIGHMLAVGTRALHIGILTAPTTTLHDSGLIVANMDERHAVVGYATSLSSYRRKNGQASNGPRSCDWEVGAVPIFDDADADLDIALVSCGYRVGDNTRAELAYDAVLESMINSAVEELASPLCSRHW